MRELFFVANWKSNKNVAQALEWLKLFESKKEELEAMEGVTIIVCPPFPLLVPMKEYIDKHLLPIKLGAQDISRFGQGKYTGEVNGALLSDFAGYVIVGHSERRAMGEDYEVLKQKVDRAIAAHMTPIFCVQDKSTPVPAEVDFVAYEPVEAIGTGKPDDPKAAGEVARVYRQERSMYYVLYGGSATGENAKGFLESEFISGFLVGNASLKAEDFYSLIRASNLSSRP